MRKLLGAVAVMAALAFMQTSAKAQVQPMYAVDGNTQTSTPRTETIYTNSGSSDHTVTVSRNADGQSGQMNVNCPQDQADPVPVAAGTSYAITVPPGGEVKVTMVSSGGYASGTWTVN